MALAIANATTFSLFSRIYITATTTTSQIRASVAGSDEQWSGREPLQWQKKTEIVKDEYVFFNTI